jgi:V/A-type H+/Na+-transporting ATPase subunit F
MEIAVLGTSEFTLGFRLAGIRNVTDVTNTPDKTDAPDREAAELMGAKDVGIVIIDQKTFDNASEGTKEDMTNSIKPVFVVVSDQPQEELRKMIIRSIGVDLMKS